MSNTEIIYNAALAHGFTADQLAQLMIAHKGDLLFHSPPKRYMTPVTF